LKNGLKRFLTLTAFLIAVSCLVIISTSASSETCESVVHALSQRLSSRINEHELAHILKTLNSTGQKRLPSKFVTKKQAKAAGWKPGKNLWSVVALKGKSIGGDAFDNREGRLPEKRWREADLDYHGGRRGSKRLVFSDDGTRMVTVDHYQTFTEAPACR
jgi:ribonuclease T1